MLQVFLQDLETCLLFLREWTALDVFLAKATEYKNRREQKNWEAARRLRIAA